MEEARIDLLQEWELQELKNGIRFNYPVPDDANGFYPYGFVRRNDSAANLVGWHGLFVSVREKGCGEQEQRCGRMSVTIFFAEEEPLKAEIPVLLRDGEAKAEVPFTLFPQELAKGNRWEFVTAVELECSCSVEIVECTFRHRPGIYIHMPVKGKSGKAGEDICYRGTVYNCASEPLMVTAEQVFEGWESLMARIHLGNAVGATFQRDEGDTGGVILEPGESVSIDVSVTVHDYMVPGGHENTHIRVCGQGSRTSSQDRVELKTLCRLQHPYLYHDTAGWKRTMENINGYAPYTKEFAGLREAADAWIIENPLDERNFCYETKTESSIMSTAYLYALTGEESYGRKLVDFFRRFSNPINGYPDRKRGCSHSYVQEGHFFKHLAIAYDIIYDSGLLSQEDKAAVEGCFRLYMEMLDVHVMNGHISNWLLSELQGAFFCALTLQDMDRALRFAFGPGGIFEQFRYGIFNDGWWHECSVGYNTWVSSIMLHTAHALLPFGYNLVHTYFQVPFNKEVSSTYRGEASVVQFGMYNQKWGGNRRMSVYIKDMFDATLPFLDDRGVLFGIADSDEKKLSGMHFGSTYDLAYHYYHDQKYLPVIARNDIDIVFGEPEVHAMALDRELFGARTAETQKASGNSAKQKYSGNSAAAREPMENAYADNIGLAMLRSRKAGRSQREQIQAVLRYGSHGNAHGHFDITELLSVMRYGRSFFNPENCWWGYAHFMYKFYVQCSLTKNMVVVDEKMQNPADSRRILWHSEDGLQAAGIEVKTKWSYPPYGGMVYTQDGQTAIKDELRKRCKMNGCYLPIVEGEGTPGYGELTGFTEPILQRRVMAVTDDYIVLFDYVEGEKEHCYDSLMQIKGFQGIDGENVRWVRHTEQMNSNPISDAQFITDCNWYEVKGGSVARFSTVFTEEHTGERMVCDRSNYNEPGVLNMDVYTAWPKDTEQMIGRVAVYDGWAADGNGYTIPLSYRVELDGREMESGAFDGWILGRGEVDLDVKGMSMAVLSLKQGVMHNEIGEPVTTPQGVFWGEICLELENGLVLNLGQEMKERMTDGGMHGVRMENVDTGYGIGRDYKNGRVTIVGTEYPYAIGASSIDHGQESRIIIDLEGLNAVRMTACIGVDAFAGDEWQKRKTYAVRSHGRISRFLTVIEPYESESVIASVDAKNPDCVQVTHKDGTIQTITLEGMEEGRPKVVRII